MIERSEEQEEIAMIAGIELSTDKDREIGKSRQRCRGKEKVTRIEEKPIWYLLKQQSGEADFLQIFIEGKLARSRFAL